MGNYRRTENRITHRCQYHVVWCSTFRRSVLTEPMCVRIKELIQAVCDKKDIKLLDINVTTNIVYIRVDIPPTEAVNTAVRNMKRVTAHVLRDEFPELRSRLPSLWTLHYLVSTDDVLTQEQIDDWLAIQPRFVAKKKKGKNVV